MSYNDKHNEDNAEDNNDGESHNRSWNCGTEGPTDDPAINALRARQQRNFLATLLLSQGVPMISHGDELGHTQHGNNNGYCQDNAITWVDWASADDELLQFTRKVATLRAEHPIFRRRRFFTGHPVRQRDKAGLPDISWLRPDGSEMTEEDWDSGFGKSIAVYFNGQGIPSLDQRGHRVTDDSFVVCFNAHHEPLQFTMPPKEFGALWRVVIDSATPETGHGDTTVPAASTVSVEARALIVLQAMDG